MTRETAVQLRDGKIIGLHGHANEKANVCFLCGGDLKAPDGHCHSTYIEVNTTKAFSAAICCACKGHTK